MRKTKDARKRNLRPYILVGEYHRPSDPELAARWDANEAELVTLRAQLEAIYAPHRDEYGTLPYTEDEDFNDHATPESEYLTPVEIERVAQLGQQLKEAKARRTCGCLVHKRIWPADWTTSAMYSTISSVTQ
jgi:hypothetical protein